MSSAYDRMQERIHSPTLCVEHVSNVGSFGTHRCTHAGKVQRTEDAFGHVFDKPLSFCGVHDPEVKRARRDEWNHQFREECDVRDAAIARKQALETATERVLAAATAIHVAIPTGDWEAAYTELHEALEKLGVAS